MNKKLIIQIIIIVGAFSSAGYILYSNLYSGGNVAVLSPNSQVSDAEAEKILPYGSTLNFNELYKRNFEYGTGKVPQLNLNEVGIEEQNLVIPLPEIQ